MLERSAALAILGLLLVTAWFALVSPYLDYLSDAYAELAHAQRKQLALQRLIENRQELLVKNRAMKINRSLSSLYISDSADVLTEAKMQGFLKRLINKHQGKLVQISRTSNDAGDKKAVSMKVDMQGGLDATYRIIHEVENGMPIMTIDNFQVDLASSHYGQQEKYLHTRYQVTAYVKR